MPGVVRRDDGWVHEAPNLGWRDVALGARLGAVLRLPVQVGNDAELGALAEHVRGVARGATDLVYVSADFGVGGGVISEGRPLRGARGYVGEIGHLVVRPGGRPCYCGSRGCWETEVGEAALRRALGLPEGTPRGVVVAELRALEAAWPRACAPTRSGEFAEWLATGLVTVVNLLAPQLVVLGDLFTALPAPAWSTTCARWCTSAAWSAGPSAAPGSRPARWAATRSWWARPSWPSSRCWARCRQAYAGRTVSWTSRPAIETTLHGEVADLADPPAGTRALSPRAESVTAVGSMGGHAQGAFEAAELDVERTARRSG